jgi:hypothetical protein
MKKSCPSIFPLLAFLLVFPFFLHRKWRVARRLVILRKPHEIFPYLNDLKNWPLWTEWARKQNIRFSYSGEPNGVGAVQHWETGCLNGVLKITHALQDERVAYDLDINHGKCSLEGVLALEPLGESTRITWMCKWESTGNPYARYLDLFYKWRLNHDFEAGLENLRNLVEGQSRA